MFLVGVSCAVAASFFYCFFCGFIFQIRDGFIAVYCWNVACTMFIDIGLLKVVVGCFSLSPSLAAGSSSSVDGLEGGGEVLGCLLLIISESGTSRCLRLGVPEK